MIAGFELGGLDWQRAEVDGMFVALNPLRGPCLGIPVINLARLCMCLLTDYSSDFLSVYPTHSKPLVQGDKE